MKILSWNCRGLGNQRAVDVLSHLVRLIQADLPYRGMLAVPSGGLALLWMEEIELHVQTFTLNHIDALIMNDTNNPWRLTGFYGWPD